MSISALSTTSLLESQLLEELTDATTTAQSSSTTAASTGSTSSTSSASFESAADTSSQSKLTRDLATLLKDLFAGNVSGSKTDLAQVQKDLKADQGSVSAATTSSSEVSPLDKLLSDISTSLSTGNTSGALTDLASFLVQSGQSSGNLVNTQA